MKSRLSALLAALLGVILLFHAGTAAAQAPPPPAADDLKTEARSHFDLGLSHFDREEWSAALVEFLKARELFPSKGATKNSAICLRKVGRFDEALDMFERLLREFPDVSPTDRALAQNEITELQASVGTVEVRDAPDGSNVTIDGVDRGKTPLKGPVRLSAGSHNVRVSKDGLLPFEGRVDLAGKQAAVVHATLAPLTQAARLRVTEHEGKVLDVVVDGAIAGQTPWDGALTPGKHSVWLRGPGKLGTQPSQVVLQLDKAETLDLTAAELEGSLRVDAKPATGEITIDGVPVGHGTWEGRLQLGPHKVAVALEGYLPFVRDVTLRPDAREDVAATLKLDPTLGGTLRPGVSLEIDAAATLGALVGGDVSSSCTGQCSESLPVGVDGVLHGTYSFPSGFGLGVHAGYLLLFRSYTARPLTLQPKGRTIPEGTINDALRLGGFVVGAEAQYRTRGDWPLTLRLGAGVLVGSVRDSRKDASFVDTTGKAFTMATAQSPGAIYFYVAPEVRFGHRFGDHFELNVGATLYAMAALSTPTWDGGQTVSTPDGLATSQSQTLTGDVVLVVAPALGARYEF